MKTNKGQYTTKLDKELEMALGLEQARFKQRILMLEKEPINFETSNRIAADD